MSNQILTNSFVSTNVGATDYVVLGQTTHPTSQILITDSSGSLLKLAVAKPTVNSASVDATLVDQSITYLSDLSGTSGNAISITLADPGSQNQALAVSVVSQAITVSLASGPDIAATKLIQGMTYTAKTAGASSNDITLTYVDPADVNIPLSVSVTVSDITVTLGTDGSGAITTNNTLLKALIEGDTDANALVSVSFVAPGTDLLIAQVLTPLAGGADYSLTSTALQVVNAITASGPASALVDVSTSASSTLLTALSETFLSGGTNGGAAFEAPIDLFQTPVSGSILVNVGSPAPIPTGSRILIKSLNGTVSSGFNVTTLLS